MKATSNETVAATPPLQQSDTEIIQAALREFVRLTDTHPNQSYREGIGNLWRGGGLTVNVTIGGGQGNGARALAAFNVNPTIDGVGSPVFTINADWILNRDISDRAKQCVLYHEAIHMTQAAQNPGKRWIFEFQIGDISDELIRILFPFEIEAHEKSCQLAMKEHVAMTDNEAGAVCIAYAAGGKARLSSTMSNLMSKLPPFAGKEALLNELTAQYQ